MVKVYVYSLPAKNGKIDDSVKLKKIGKSIKSWNVVSDDRVIIETTNELSELDDYKIKEYQTE